MTSTFFVLGDGGLKSISGLSLWSEKKEQTHRYCQFGRNGVVFFAFVNASRQPVEVVKLSFEGKFHRLERGLRFGQHHRHQSDHCGHIGLDLIYAYAWHHLFLSPSDTTLHSRVYSRINRIFRKWHFVWFLNKSPSLCGLHFQFRMNRHKQTHVIVCAHVQIYRKCLWGKTKAIR